MMACVANKIVAAPFAVLGSIGVIAQVPNFNRILKRNDVEYHEVTAGQFKRTVTLFGEITPAGYSKFREQIEETHRLFKEFVKAYRPSLNIEKTATGEHWFGTQAVELGLVDELRASDDYVIEKCQTHDVYTVGYRSKKRFSERISDSLSAVLQMALESSLQKLWSHIQQSRFGS
jgi:serine protease SohB